MFSRILQVMAKHKYVLRFALRVAATLPFARGGAILFNPRPRRPPRPPGAPPHTLTNAKVCAFSEERHFFKPFFSQFPEKNAKFWLSEGAERYILALIMAKNWRSFGGGRAGLTVE